MRTGKEMLRLMRSLAAKFIPNENDCWEWTAYKTKLGYGMVWAFGRAMLAHRAAYVVAFGHVPKGMKVCHSCDNRACINVDHMFLGTQGDNMRDAAKKGRLGIQTGAASPLRGPTLRNSLATHCINGHPLSGKNLKIVGARRMRRCVACFRNRDKLLKRRMRSEERARRESAYESSALLSRN